MLFCKLLANEIRKDVQFLKKVSLFLPNPQGLVFVASKEFQKKFPKINKKHWPELGIRIQGAFLGLDEKVYLAVHESMLLDNLDKQNFAEYFQKKQILNYFRKLMADRRLNHYYQLSSQPVGKVLLFENMALTKEKRFSLEIIPGIFLKVRQEQVDTRQKLNSLRIFYFVLKTLFSFIQNYYKGLLLSVNEREVSRGRHDIRNIMSGQELIEIMLKKKIMSFYQKAEDQKFKLELEELMNDVQQISHNRIGLINILNALPGERRAEERPKEVKIANLISYILLPHIRMLVKGQAVELIESIPENISDEAVVSIPITSFLSAIDNLVINSLEAFSKSEQERILMFSVSLDNELKIILKDNGMGICPATLQKIKKGLNASTKGSGLGLKSVANIMARCGGTMSIDSTMGVGTTVELSLPYRLSQDKKQSHHQVLINIPSRRELYDALHQDLFRTDYSILYDEQLKRKNIFYSRKGDILDQEIELKVLREVRKFIALQEKEGILVFKISEDIHVYTVYTNNGIEIHIGKFSEKIDEKYEQLLLLKEKQEIIAEYLRQDNILDDSQEQKEKFLKAWREIPLVDRLASHIPVLYEKIHTELLTIRVADFIKGARPFYIPSQYNGRINIQLPEIILGAVKPDFSNRVLVMLNYRPVKSLSLETLKNNNNIISIELSELQDRQKDSMDLVILIEDNSKEKWNIIMNSDELLFDFQENIFDFFLKNLKIPANRLFNRQRQKIAKEANLKFILMRYFTKDNDPTKNFVGDILIAENNNSVFDLVNEQIDFSDDSSNSVFKEVWDKLAKIQDKKIWYKLYGLDAYSLGRNFFQLKIIGSPRRD